MLDAGNTVCEECGREQECAPCTGCGRLLCVECGMVDYNLGC